MAYGGGDYVDISIPAAADLSALQYRFIVVDANGRGTVPTSPVTPLLGILQNKPPAINTPARVRVQGISKLAGGAALNENDMLCSTAASDGYGTAAAAGQVGVFVGALCLTATGGSGDIADVLVTRFIL